MPLSLIDASVPASLVVTAEDVGVMVSWEALGVSPLPEPHLSPVSVVLKNIYLAALRVPSCSM